MKLSKRTERIITAGMVAALVAYFCYQVAYGMTMGPSGTMNVPGMPNGTWATIAASPGTKVRMEAYRQGLQYHHYQEVQSKIL